MAAKDFYETKGIPEGYNKKGTPIRVLVVDDEQLTRSLIIQVLKSVGFEIVGEAENGLDGVEQFKMFKPDIVTMDVRMPQMDGIGALKKIKEINKDAVVVMLTAENDSETVTELLKSGAANYIVKPVKRDLILEKMRLVKKKMGI